LTVFFNHNIDPVVLLFSCSRQQQQDLFADELAGYGSDASRRRLRRRGQEAGQLTQGRRDEQVQILGGLSAEVELLKQFFAILNFASSGTEFLIKTTSLYSGGIRSHNP
jgi:hypothetical protein